MATLHSRRHAAGTATPRPSSSLGAWASPRCAGHVDQSGDIPASRNPYTTRRGPAADAGRTLSSAARLVLRARRACEAASNRQATHAANGSNMTADVMPALSKRPASQYPAKAETQVTQNTKAIVRTLVRFVLRGAVTVSG